ncbi:MAG: PQQ-binding-like beta-propeller repeat protein [Bradymonadia bacterium]
MPTHLSPGWRRDFSEGRLETLKGVQLASPAVDVARNRLCLGTPDGHLECMTASGGQTLWRKRIPPRKAGQEGTPLNLEAAAAVAEAEADKEKIRRTSSHSAIFDGGQLIVGTDDGLLLCLDSASGEEIWRYEVPGALIRKPLLVKDRVVFVDGTNTVYALDRNTGAWVWQVQRPPPAEFALSSEGAPASDGERVYVGFSDGHLVALSLQDGAQIWKRDLAPEHDKFEDVDATPQVINGTLYAASAASALYALDPSTGDVRWTQPIEGIVGLHAFQGDLIASTDRSTVIRLSGHDGSRRWRLRYPGGAANEAVTAGQYVVVTLAEIGLQFINPHTGQPIQRFNPGHGVSAPATVTPEGHVYFVGDGGVLYSLVHRKTGPGRSTRSEAPFGHYGLDN